MTKIFAYIDESGDPRFNEGASERLEYSSIIIDANKENEITNELLFLRDELNLSEFKSSNVRSERRRIQILEAIQNIEFKFINLSIDKNKVIGEWKSYPKVFYKYTQKILNNELHRLYSDRSVNIDKFGSSKYQKSLKKYLEKEIQLEIDGTVDINISSAKKDILIQIADFIAGTNRKLVSGDFNQSEKIKNLLNCNKLYILNWPCDYNNFHIESSSNVDDELIANCAINIAQNFIDSKKEEEKFKPHILILEYLLFQAKFVAPNKYIYSNELVDWLKSNRLVLNDEDFRKDVIGSLRDNGVVIASSVKGLKIPLTNSELVEYINFTTSRYLTSIQRLKKTYQSLNSCSLEKIEIFNSDNFKIHKDFFDLIS